MTTKAPPKLLKAKISYLGRFRNPRYLLYTLRELSGLFVSIYALLLAYQLSQLIFGPTVYQGATNLLQSPPILAFDVVVLAFALLHAVTWIDLNILVLPPIKIAGTKIKRIMLLGAGLVLWVIVSGIVAMLLLAR